MVHLRVLPLPLADISYANAKLYVFLNVLSCGFRPRTAVECPANMSFQPKVPVQAATCANQNPGTDTENLPGCVCDQGFVLNDAGECVAKSECGCYEHDGTQRDVSERNYAE